jgi:hypothetical protein
LVIAFTVIVGDDVLNGCPQRLLPEEDHTFRARLLDAADKSLRVGVQIGRPRWQLHRLHAIPGLRHSREMTRVCSRNLTQRPAFGGDDNAFPTCGLRIKVRRFWWVTLSEHKWVILGERRGPR